MSDRPQQPVGSPPLNQPPPAMHARDASATSVDSEPASYDYDSRSSTPELMMNPRHEKTELYGDNTDSDVPPVPAVGILPDEVYERTMSWWRVRFRRLVSRNLQWETKVIASMQVRMPCP